MSQVVATTPQTPREKILAIEAVMKAMPPAEPGEFGRIDIETTHYFAPGVYMRQVRIPKGATVVGMIHRTEHLNILSQGKLEVETEDGIKVLTASTVVLSKPGIKRVGHALEDSVWITVHPNVDDVQDVPALEQRLVAHTFEELEAQAAPKQIQGGA